jgi:ABC-type transport system involved in cytochrome bd biosynthesis fused ATPase/permease subunit
MGGSGAGKTTLMDCILGRKTTGLIRGDILVNGHPKEQATWSRVCGWVEWVGRGGWGDWLGSRNACTCSAVLPM